MDIDNALITATGAVTVIADWQGQLSVESRSSSAVHPARSSAMHEATVHTMFRPFARLPLFSASEVQVLFFQLLPSVER